MRRLRVPKAPSFRELKPLEAVQFFLDAALEVLSRAPLRGSADPAPFLHQQFAALAVGLEVDGGDDVVTSKNRQGALRGLALVKLEEMMDVLVCADEVINPKPHPEPVEKAVELLGADPATTVYVGDSIHDMHSGRAAGVRTAAALWGPFGRGHLEGARPDYWLETPADLLTLAAG